MIIDLSIDFDFFSREDPMWDLGHNDENMMFQTNTIWNTRYERYDLHAETDQKTYVGFTSRELFGKMLSLGFDFKRFHVSRNSGIADSHKLAFDFFRNSRVAPPDVLLNIDAHHDAFEGEGLNCGTWIPRLLEYWYTNKTPRVWQVYPKWKDVDIDGPPHMTFDFINRWAAFEEFIGVLREKNETLQIRRIFLCRSGAWVPPHFENEFVDLARRIVAMSKTAPMLESILKRHPTTSVEAEQMRADAAERWKASGQIQIETSKPAEDNAEPRS